MNFLNSVIFIEPKPGKTISGGFHYNNQIFSRDFCSLNQIDKIQVDDLSELNLSNHKDRFLIFDSLFLHDLARKKNLPNFGLLMHYLPSMNPLLTQAARDCQRSDETKVFKKTKLTITTGDFLRRELLQFANNIHVCFPAYQEFNSISDKSKDLQILSVASVLPEKGLHTTLAALIELKSFPWTWKIVGTTNDTEYLNQLIRNLKQHKLEDRVEFLGGCTQVKVKQLIAESKIFISSSLYESSPMAPIEARAAGLPVIHSSVGEMIELKKKDLGISLFCREDISDLIGKLNSVLLKPERTPSQLTLTTRSWVDAQREMKSILQHR